MLWNELVLDLPTSFWYTLKSIMHSVYARNMIRCWYALLVWIMNKLVKQSLVNITKERNSETTKRKNEAAKHQNETAECHLFSLLTWNFAVSFRCFAILCCCSVVSFFSNTHAWLCFYVYLMQFGSFSHLHLPKKKSFRNTDKNFLEKRKQDLDFYLQVNVQLCVCGKPLQVKDMAFIYVG